MGPGPSGPGSEVSGDEPPMTACGGNFIGGEISRNKQSPKELRRLRLRMEEAPCLVSFAYLKCSLMEKASNIRTAPPLKVTAISIIIEAAFKEGAERIKRKGDEENEQTDDGFDHHGRFRHQPQS